MIGVWAMLVIVAVIALGICVFDTIIPPYRDVLLQVSLLIAFIGTFTLFAFHEDK